MGSEALRMEAIKVSYRTPAGQVHAINNVSLSVAKGETLGIAGENGAGKSSLALTAFGLVEKQEGAVYVDGQLYKRKKSPALLGCVLSQPEASLNPRFRVFRALAEPLGLVAGMHRADKESAAVEMMELAGLDASLLNLTVAHLNASQRVRLAVARALIAKPVAVILDDPFAYLDIALQARIANMLIAFQEKNATAYIIFSGSLSMLRHLSDELGVLYLGSIVEMGKTEAIEEDVLHPYVRALFAAEPTANPKLAQAKSEIAIKGVMPAAGDIPSGCKFHTRCPYAQRVCETMEPDLAVKGVGHYVRCYMA